MERQNITLALPRNLLKKAKAIAASQDISLSQLLRETLEEKIKNEAGFKAAKRRQMSLLESGLDLGTKGQITTTREELHER
jgi:hypothetical protein